MARYIAINYSTNTIAVCVGKFLNVFYFIITTTLITGLLTYYRVYV